MAELREEIERLKADVAFENQVAEARSAECLRLSKERESLAVMLRTNSDSQSRPTKREKDFGSESLPTNVHQNPWDTPSDNNMLSPSGIVAGDSEHAKDTEIKRLQKIEIAAKRLRTQRNRLNTMGCSWSCRKMLDLFDALESYERSESDERGS